MAFDTNSTLTSLKTEALSSVIQAMQIEYPQMASTLSSLNNGNSSFSSLLGLYTPTFRKLSSFDLNGSMLLAYLDFYTLYILLYANLDPINNLKKITQNKLSYLLSIYKDTDSVIKEKELQKLNKYVSYTNFLNPKNIDLSVSRSYLSKNRLSDPLTTYPVLSLPVESTKDINVLSVSSSDTDSYTNIIENNTSGDSIEYSINRKGFNKIGVCDSVVPLKAGNTYSESPSVTGTVHGYFSESVSVVIADVILDDNGNPTSVSVIGSSNNIDWSEPTTVGFDIPATFYIDNQVDIGLTIQLSSGLTPAIGDSWKINLRYINIDNPMLVSAIKFMSLDKISFITWNDVAKESAEFISQRVKYRRDEKYRDLNYKVFSNGINNVATIFNNVNDYEITLKQNFYEVKPVDGQLTHSFKFNLTDIKGVYNEYKSYGITSFKGIEATQQSPILNVNVGSDEFISKSYLYTVQPTSVTQVTSWNLDLSGYNAVKIGTRIYWKIQGGVVRLYDSSNVEIAYGTYDASTKIVTFTEYNGSNITGTAMLNSLADNTENNFILVLSKQFIEYSLFIIFGKDTLFIPCLNGTETEITEYVIPEKQTDGSYKYLTKFAVDETKDPILSNVSSREILSSSEYTTEWVPVNPEHNPNKNRKFRVTVSDYDMKSVYAITYTPKVNTYVEATNYITGQNEWMYNNGMNNSNIYYMYYRDINNINKVALCTLGELDVQSGNTFLTPFYGTVSSVIEMRSLDQGYVSPVIFEHKLLAN